MDDWMDGPDGVRRCLSARTVIEIHDDRLDVVVPRRGAGRATLSVPGIGFEAARHLLQIAVLNGVRLDACKIIARLAESLSRGGV